MMSWNLILCLWLLRIGSISALSLALKYSKKHQGIRGGSQTISFRRQNGSNNAQILGFFEDEFHKENLHFRGRNFGEWLNLVQGFY